MNIVADTILWAALASLSLMAIGIFLSMITSDVRWGDLLATTDGAAPTLTRTGYLFGNIGLAATFLLAVLDSGADPARLNEASNLFGVLDASAVSGAASIAYVYSKLTSQSVSKPDRG